MTKITLDTSIATIDEIDAKTKAFFEKEKINTLGELLVYSPHTLYRRLSDVGIQGTTITNHIHEMGLVFLGEDGFLELLRAHIFKKYNVTNFNLNTFTVSEKSTLLDYKLYELLAFLPDNNGRDLRSFCIEAKYSSLTLQEALAHGHVNKKNTFLYSEQLTTWYGYIRSLGFEFSEAKGYHKQMTQLVNAKDDSKKDNGYDLDTRIEVLNTFTEIFRKGEELSDKDLEELRHIKPMFTLRDIICIDDKDYSKLPGDLLARIKVFLNNVRIPFIGDENFAEFKKHAKAGEKILKKAEDIAERTKIEQRFNSLKSKFSDLIERRAILEYDNYSLGRINMLLTDMIDEMAEIQSTAQTKGKL